MADIGYGALLLTFLCAGYAVLAFVIGIKRHYTELTRSAENGLKLAAAWAIVASIILCYVLLARDYQVKYVYEHVSSYMRLEYVLSAFWAGQEGSLLLWLLFVALTSLALLGSLKDEAGLTLRPYLLATVAVVETFIALLLILPSNPFVLLPTVSNEGKGLNPLLENWGMIVHPPMLFVGYALYTVPFAFVIAGLLSGQSSDIWLERMRRWSLLAWLFLGIGILLGAWWAYVELGWGGYWSWDPVENSSLIPWLIGTAALHSGAMQHRRGIFRVWTAALVLLSFGLCLFATFVTRSGVIQSVHAFERSSIAIYFVVFLVMVMAGGFALLWARRRMLASEYVVDSFLSREAGFLLGNLLFIGAASVVFLGTIFPTMTELIRGTPIALDALFFNRAFSPLGLALILLFGVCPVLGWQRTSVLRLGRQLLPGALGALVALLAMMFAGIHKPVALVGFTSVAFVAGSIISEWARGTWARRRATGELPWVALVNLVRRDRRRYGGFIVHFSVLLIALGIIGSTIYKSEQLVALQLGERTQVGPYALQYVDFVYERLPEKERLAAILDVYQHGRLAKRLMPEKNYHWNIEQLVSEVAVWSRPAEDVYVALASMQQDGTATFEISINPLIIWMWVGGGLLVLGTVVAWWPSASKKE